MWKARQKTYLLLPFVEEDELLDDRDLRLLLLERRRRRRPQRRQPRDPDLLRPRKYLVVWPVSQTYKKRRDMQ